MKRCKFCNEVIDVVGTTFCPVCGNNVNAEPKKTKKKNIKPVPELNREFSNEKVGPQEVRVVTGKKMEGTKVKSGVRKSYIFFGILALLAGAILCATSIYRLFEIWGPDFLYEKTYEMSLKIYGDRTLEIKENGMIVNVIDGGNLLFTSVLVWFATFTIIGTFLSLFHRKQSLSSFFAKIAVILAMPVVILESADVLFDFLGEKAAEIEELFMKQTENTYKIGAFGSLGCFVLMIIFSFVNKGKAYRATSYKGLRAFVWTLFAVLAYLLNYVDLNLSEKMFEIIEKVYATIAYGLPVFLVIGAILMFGGAKYRGDE